MRSDLPPLSDEERIVLHCLRMDGWTPVIDCLPDEETPVLVVGYERKQGWGVTVSRRELLQDERSAWRDRLSPELADYGSPPFQYSDISFDRLDWIVAWKLLPVVPECVRGADLLTRQGILR